jgi:hypothetical protein
MNYAPAPIGQTPIPRLSFILSNIPAFSQQRIRSPLMATNRKMSYLAIERRRDSRRGEKMTAVKPERVEFNPQRGIAVMMIERNRRQKQTHHIAYRCGMSL